MRDIVDFLSEELNRSIDVIDELKNLINKTEIDITTAVSYSQNIKSKKDDTVNFFMSESLDDRFSNNEINNLNSEVEALNEKLIKYKRELEYEDKRITDIKELLSKYNFNDKDDVLDCSVSNISNISSLIKSADSVYDDMCKYLTDEVMDELEIIQYNNNLTLSLINSDPSRAALELEKNSDVVSNLLHSLKIFISKLYLYNPEKEFQDNFNNMCERYNDTELYFESEYNDELNRSSEFNINKCKSYFKMISSFIEYINLLMSDEDVSRETYKIEVSIHKSRIKSLFILDKKYDFIQKSLLKDNQNTILIKLYLNICNSYMKFKKLKNHFIIEIDNDLN